MKALLIFAVLLPIPASAQTTYPETLHTWECGKDVTVELRKNAVHDHTLTFSGDFTVWSPTGKRITGVKFEYVGHDGAILNGKRCRLLPGGLKWDEDIQGFR